VFQFGTFTCYEQITTDREQLDGSRTIRM